LREGSLLACPARIPPGGDRIADEDHRRVNTKARPTP
jgi:hypothetical protein